MCLDKQWRNCSMHVSAASSEHTTTRPISLVVSVVLPTSTRRRSSTFWNIRSTTHSTRSGLLCHMNSFHPITILHYHRLHFININCLVVRSGKIFPSSESENVYILFLIYHVFLSLRIHVLSPVEVALLNYLLCSPPLGDSTPHPSVRLACAHRWLDNGRLCNIQT